MEAIEDWHAEELPQPRSYGSYRDLRERYCLRLCAASEHSSTFRAADLDSIPIGWIEGRDMWTGEPRFVPWSLCSLDFTRTAREALYLPGSSNGLAAGNTVDEAFCHALFEAVEREAEAAFVQVSSSRRVDHRTIDSPHLLSLLDACERSKISVCTFDMTNEIGIPTYRVIIHDREELTRNPGGFSGSGAHLSPEVALSRALTEAIQARLTLISGSRDDIPPTVYIHARRPSARHVVSEETGTIPFRRRSEPLPGSFSGWIGELLSRLKESGFSEVICVDLTREHLGIPVVKVLVPGCRFHTASHINKPLPQGL
jgi:ribosomal protein S12 methylthiotransferase accessory factor